MPSIETKEIRQVKFLHITNLLQEKVEIMKMRPTKTLYSPHVILAGARPFCGI
jgi:hypothetical protein